MAGKSNIEWCTDSWNPIVGCSVVSPGCTNCYAMRQAGTRLKNTPLYRGLTQPSKGGPVWTGELRLNEKTLDKPLHWRKPRRIFVNSMSDLFHESVPDEWLDRIFLVMARSRQHQFQALTKRPERARQYLNSDRVLLRFAVPVRNVWIGTSIEDRRRLGRIDSLRATPATVRFISFEPLLEELTDIDLTGIHWAIIGGESGPKARPFHLAWARSIIQQCKAAGVACFVKQLGANVLDGVVRTGAGGRWDNIPVTRELRDPKGGNPDEWPEDLRVREWPT